MTEPNSLIFKIDFVNSIEVNDLVLSLNGLNNQYAKFLEEDDNNPLKQELKLYIREIKKGSIVADLFTATAASGVITFAENVITIIEFAKSLKTSYDYFLGKAEKNKNYTKTELKNLRRSLNLLQKITAHNYLFKIVIM